jgi:predicted CxxxxCH...CXXCH cytochrome family protein
MWDRADERDLSAVIFPEASRGHPLRRCWSPSPCVRSAPVTSIRASAVAIAVAFLGAACDTARDVETAAAASHPTQYVPAHAPAALADLNGCRACHGADYDGGSTGVSCNGCHGLFGFSDWQTNCTFCHGTRTQGWTSSPGSLVLAAPPFGSHRETQTSEPPVGAHQKHLGNGSLVSDGVACTECHVVPADLSHVGGGAAAVAFGPLASQGGLTPAYAGGTCASTYCHGATLAGGGRTTPSWTGSAACGDCHGSPPVSGRHTTTVNHSSQHCSACHATVATNTTQPGVLDTPAARALHVNGAKDVSFAGAGTWTASTKTCSNVACHTGQPADRLW